MRFISTKIHGYLDYLFGVVLMATPWVLNFDKGGAETWVPVCFGAAALLYSLLTDYEPGASPRIPMHIHLFLDFLGGALLAVSPWLFKFSEHISTPHLVLGFFAVVASLFTKTNPGVEQDHGNIGNQHANSLHERVSSK